MPIVLCAMLLMLAGCGAEHLSEEEIAEVQALIAANQAPVASPTPSVSVSPEPSPEPSVEPTPTPTPTDCPKAHGKKPKKCHK